MVSEKAILDYLVQFDDVTVTEQLIEDKQSKTLQARYESVMESRALGRNGIEIICSGQLSDDEVMDLVRHGYEMSAPETE